MKTLLLNLKRVFVFGYACAVGVIGFRLVALLIVALTGCQPEAPVTRASNGRSYTVIEVDGCEYLEFEGYHGRAVTHKGNCSNPNHCK